MNFTSVESLQPAGREIRKFYEAAHAQLKHDFLTLSRNDVETVGRALGETVRRRPYTCYACAIMPDHVHLLIRKHRDTPEHILAELQNASRTAILQCGERPASHPVWGGLGWNVYLNTADDMRRVGAYIERNPVKPQRWEFVQPYDGWLPGQVSLRRPAKSQAKRSP